MAVLGSHFKIHPVRGPGLSELESPAIPCRPCAHTRRSAIVSLYLFALLLIGGLNLAAQTPIPKEYQVKAAFLFNFAQFIEWPPNTFTNTDTPFRIGVLGDSPFGGALSETVQGEAINKRAIAVLHSRQLAELKDCQIIFICKSEKGSVGSILAGLNSTAILTVSELDGFTQNGGSINFYLEGRKVRFEINPTAAQSHGLKVSSQLLSLGKIVGTPGRMK